MANPGIEHLERCDIAIPDQAIQDLKERLRATRWPDDIGNNDWFYGVNGGYLKGLVDYWINRFDWAAAQARLNEVANYRVVIDDVPIHFVHIPGKGPAPVPLILSHGWPWSYREYGKVWGPLSDPAAFGGDQADAFDVIIPSLPGFGFSTPVMRPDLNFWRIADLFQKLMTETLGNDRYAVGGADMGALVSGQLGHKYAGSLYGVWLGHTLPMTIFNGERAWDMTDGQMVPKGASSAVRDGILSFQRRYAAHVAVHVLDSETHAYGLTDSPVGMLAGILERWRAWSESGGDVERVFPRDHLLTNATIWWVGSSIRNSMRIYANAARYHWRPSHDRQPVVEAPVGVTFVGYENPPGVCTADRVAAFEKSPQASFFNTTYLKAHERGGHFTPWENPEAVIEDIRATFRPLR